MRAAFQQFQVAVTKAIQQLEEFAVGVAGRVDDLEARTDALASIFADRSAEPEDAVVEALVQAAIRSAMEKLEPAVDAPTIDYGALLLDVQGWLSQQDLRGKDAEPLDYELVTRDLEGWLAENLPKFIPEPKNGKDGAPGKDGSDGAPGKDGKDGLDGAPGKDGADGLPGKDGKDGLPGKDGADGRDGVGIEKAEIIDDELVIHYTDGQTQFLGRVVGKDGTTTIQTIVSPGVPGQDGVGIQDVVQEGTEIVLILTDGTRKRFQLPEPRRTRTIGMGGRSKQQIFINEEPEIDYPAISFVSDNDGYFSMRLNCVG